MRDKRIYEFHRLVSRFALFDDPLDALLVGLGAGLMFSVLAGWLFT